MRYLTLICLLVVILLSCTASRCTTPTIISFTAGPKSFCQLPQRITVKWQVVAQTITLKADPPTPELSAPRTVDPNGSLDVEVNANTTFTLTASLEGQSATKVEMVSRLTGEKEYALGGLATCQGGRFVHRIEVLEDEYSRDVVIRSLTNPGSQLITVQGPRGATTISPLATSGVLNGSPLVGGWTITSTPNSPCSSGTTSAPDTALIGLKASVGCP